MQGEAAMVPEDVGRKAAHVLLEEIARGGVTDVTHQVNHIALHPVWHSATRACFRPSFIHLTRLFMCCQHGAVSK